MRAEIVEPVANPYIKVMAILFFTGIIIYFYGLVSIVFDIIGWING